MLSRAGTEAALAGVFPLYPRRRVRGRPFGSMPSSRRGGCFDPVSSRPYRPGDDLRRIDRHASARLSAARDSDELVVREHYAEEAARVVPVVDPLEGRMRRVRLRRHEAAERRAANEARLAQLVEALEQLGLEPVLLGSADEERVLDGFQRWADVRRRSA